MLAQVSERRLLFDNSPQVSLCKASKMKSLCRIIVRAIAVQMYGERGYGDRTKKQIKKDEIHRIPSGNMLIFRAEMLFKVSPLFFVRLRLNDAAPYVFYIPIKQNSYSPLTSNCRRQYNSRSNMSYISLREVIFRL